jgi:CheY-like chemotaxis protein
MAARILDIPLNLSRVPARKQARQAGLWSGPVARSDRRMHSGDQTGPQHAKPRLLFLEQTRALQGIMRKAFIDAGYDVAMASTLTELETLIERFEPNVILVEVNLRAGKGDDICRHIKERALRLTPVVLVSGIPEAELKQRAQDAGADRYYCKSRGLAELVELVDELTSEIVF